MCLPLVNSPKARHFRGEPRYLLYKKQIQSSLGATQTNSQFKTKGRTTPSSPYPAQVGSVFYQFSLRPAKVVQEFFDDCNTFIKEREWTPTHCTVRSFIIRGGNNEGWAEIHTRTQSSARLPSFPGEIDSGPRGPCSVPPQQKKCSVLCLYPCHSAAQTLTREAVLTHFYNHRGHPHITLLAEWEQMNESSQLRLISCPQRTMPCEPWVRPRPWPKLQKPVPLPPTCWGGTRVSKNLCGWKILHSCEL